MNIYKPQVFDFEESSQLLNQATNYILDKFLDTNAEQGMVRFALSNGDLANLIYKNFFKVGGLPLDRLSVFQTDERIDAGDSFQAFLKEEILKKNNVEIAEFNTFNLDKKPAEAIIEYQEYLENLDGNLFDLTVLELQIDGSVAGLFPNTFEPENQQKFCVTVTTPADQTELFRHTLTAQAILNSDEILLLIQENKQGNLLARLLEGSEGLKQMPAKFLLAHPKLKIFRIA